MITIFHPRMLINNEVGADALSMSFIAADVFMVEKWGAPLFYKDERGVVEPNSDLVAMALAVIGFVIFISVMAHTYQIYQEKTLIVQHYDRCIQGRVAGCGRYQRIEGQVRHTL